MRTATILLVLFLSKGLTFGQNDFLMPCQDIGRVIKEIEAYDSKLNKILLKNFIDMPLARYVVKPSFDPEYAFQLENPMDSIFILKVNYLKSNLWHSQNRDTIIPITIVKIIDADFAYDLVCIFQSAFDSVENRSASSMGEDGVYYYFFKSDMNQNITCGYTWSPNKGSKMFNLVQICDMIAEYIIRSNNDFISIKKLIDTFLVDY